LSADLRYGITLLLAPRAAYSASSAFAQLTVDSEMMAVSAASGKEERTQFGVQSVEIGLRVLAALANAQRPLMLRELAKVLEMPSAKVHRYLVSLIRAGMVEQNGAGGRYGLGPLALNVGLAALNQIDVIRTGVAFLAELRDRIDQTGLLAIWGPAGPTIVRWEDCRRPIAVNVRVGSVLRLLDSATGLVFAAFLPHHLTEDLMAEELADRSREEVENMLAEVRRRGMSRVRGQQLASINALSAPIFDHANHLVAAITLLGPEQRFDVDWDGAIANELRTVARQLSERLGAPLKG
jgi:DNA-binding IclR family transcriptional regulator